MDFVRHVILTVSQIVKPQDVSTNCAGEVLVDAPLDHHTLARPLFRNDIILQTIAKHLNNLLSANNEAMSGLSYQNVLYCECKCY